MKIIFKSILLIFGFFLVFFLIIVSFFVPIENTIKDLSIPLNANTSGEFEYDLSGEKSKMYLSKISAIDYIYSDKSNNYSLNKIGDFFYINLKPGKYIIDINDLSKKYIISSDSFKFYALSTGKVYIDCFDEKSNILFSLNMVLELDFLKSGSDLSINKSYLFPHEFIKFNGFRNTSISGADFLRVKKQVFYGSYVKDSLYELEDIDLLNKLLGDGIYFLRASVGKIKELNNQNKKIETKIEDLSYKKLAYINLIEKYFNFFINKSKKTVYYKNILLRDIIELSKSSKADPILINDINTNLENLKEIDKEEYQNIKTLIENYYITFSLSNKELDRIKNSNFLSLISGERAVYSNSFLKISDYYHSFDFDNKGNLNIKMNLFIDSFYKEVGFSYENNTFTFKDSFDENILDYFSYYLKSYLIVSLDDLYSLENLDSYISLISKYINLSNYIYFDSNSLKDKKLGFSENLDLFSKIDSFLRYSFFQDKRGDNGLLILQDKKTYDISFIEDLEKNIIDFREIFKQNRDIISEPVYFENVFSNLIEYFSALKSYDKYTLEYNEIFTIDQSNNKNRTIDENYFVDFMSRFRGINYDNFTLDFINKEYFSVKNILVNGKNISFDFFPYDSNKIDNIIVDEKEIFVSYKIDELFDLGSGNSSDSIEDFFLNTFSDSKIVENDPKVKTPDDIKIVVNDSPIVSRYKRVNLLGENGDFSAIKSFVDLNYENVLVKEETGKFSVNIDKAFVNIFYQNSYINLELSGEYLDKENSFRNLEFKIYDNFYLNKGEKYLFNGSKIYFVGDVSIGNLKDYIYGFFDNIENIDKMYKILSEFSPNVDITIKYSYNEQAFFFELNYNSSNLSIKLLKNTIEYVYYSGDKIGENIEMSNLTKTLIDLK